MSQLKSRPRQSAHPPPLPHPSDWRLSYGGRRLDQSQAEHHISPKPASDGSSGTFVKDCIVSTKRILHLRRPADTKQLYRSVVGEGSPFFTAVVYRYYTAAVLLCTHVVQLHRCCFQLHNCIHITSLCTHSEEGIGYTLVSLPVEHTNCIFAVVQVVLCTPVARVFHRLQGCCVHCSCCSIVLCGC